MPQEQTIEFGQASSSRDYLSLDQFSTIPALTEYLDQFPGPVTCVYLDGVLMIVDDPPVLGDLPTTLHGAILLDGGDVSSDS